VLVLAYDYPLLGAFWTMFVFFIWIAWLFLLFKIFADIFRSPDLGGGVKAVWCIFIILVPFLGTFVYVIARGKQMTEHDIEAARSQQAAFDEYVRSTAGTGGSAADELAKLADLKQSGVISDAEFEQQKAKLLT
jgi:Short C-terminal domain/Phospholipase_D-nuclease N-terminal